MSRKAKKIRVVAAMSGGVDSSVAAYLLKEAGFDVVGVTMKIWPSDGAASKGQKSCCGVDAVCDAQRVADILGIPYYAIDMVDDFESTVIANFASEYAAGRTPNPCVRCNIDMKFGRLLAKARQIGAEKVATGHYARIDQDSVSGRYRIFRALTDEKDQSYAMWGLTQQQLARALFPLGELSKPQVRQIAEQLGLPVAQKPDSQEICFVSTGDYRDFLKGRAPGPGPGSFVDTQGAVVGEHPGHTGFTVGQRRGLGTAFGERTYVVAVDAPTNRVTLGSNADLMAREFRVQGVNWVAIEAPTEALSAHVKVRYNGDPQAARLTITDLTRVQVETTDPFRAVTPGQSAVFYDDVGMVLGGGTIAGPGRWIQ